MGEILNLEPAGIEKSIHPRALELFEKFRADVGFSGPLKDITTDDLYDYPRDNEKTIFQIYMKQITDGLGEFIDISDANSPEIQSKLRTFETNLTNLIIHKVQIQSFLEKVYERKMKHMREQQRQKQQEEKRQIARAEEERRQQIAKAEEERRQQIARAEEERRQQIAKAEEERRQQIAIADEERKNKELEKKRSAAFAALKIPADAEKYLHPEEYEEFAKSINEAIHAYLDRGESWASDTRATQYLCYIDKIAHRRQEEQDRVAAIHKATAYNQSLNMEIARVKSLLRQRRQNLEKRFEKHAADTRYTGHCLAGLLSEDDKQSLDELVGKIVRKRLIKLVCADFREFVVWEHSAEYFPLPFAEYSFEGVSCLDFHLSMFCVVETRIWTKPGQKDFGGYLFNLPKREEKGYSVELGSEFLGYDYLVLTPDDIGAVFWKTIPLALVMGLMSCDEEPPGIDILEASDASTTYSIEGFEDQVTISEVFANYLKTIDGVDGMLGLGVISIKVHSIVEKRLTQLEADENDSPNRDSEPKFIDADLLASLTNLGISTEEAEAVIPLVPDKLELKEAIKVAMQKLAEISSQNSNGKTE